MAVIIAITNNVIFGTLFLKVKSENFKDIIGSLLIINQLNLNITAYRNHRFKIKL